MDNLIPDELFVSVDVETAGPNPSQYSLLSIGACTLTHPRYTFYVELKPVNDSLTTAARDITGLSFERLQKEGLEPAKALLRFEAWLQKHTRPGQRPVFVGFNAPFDWMFVNDYFHRFLGRNPFGHAALDIKSFYMGLTGVAWGETGLSRISPRYLGGQPLSHQALEDATLQGKLFELMLAEARQRKKPSEKTQNEH